MTLKTTIFILVLGVSSWFLIAHFVETANGDTRFAKIVSVQFESENTNSLPLNLRLITTNYVADIFGSTVYVDKTDFMIVSVPASTNEERTVHISLGVLLTAIPTSNIWIHLQRSLDLQSWQTIARNRTKRSCYMFGFDFWPTNNASFYRWHIGGEE